MEDGQTAPQLIRRHGTDICPRASYGSRALVITRQPFLRLTSHYCEACATNAHSVPPWGDGAYLAHLNANLHFLPTQASMVLYALRP